MKILLVFKTTEISGGERIGLYIHEFLKYKYDFFLFFPQNPDIELDNLIYPYKNSFRDVISTLEKTIYQRDIKIVHAHSPKAAMWLKLFCLLNRKTFKFIYTIHGIHFVHYKFPLNILFTIYEIITNRMFVDALICVGIDDYNLAKKLKLISDEKLFLIENGIDLTEFENLEDYSIKKEFNIKNEKIIVTVCRLHYQKDIETAIRAIKLLENEKIKFLIVGDGPERNKLEKLTKSLKLENKVIFLGHRNDVNRILKIADIFVLSTKWEGLALVILESFASKIPVIASNVHGNTSVIVNGENGLLFKFKDPKDLAKKILLLLRDENLRARIVENAYNSVKSRFNVERMIRRYDNLYSHFFKNQFGC